MTIIQVTTGLDQNSGGPFFFAQELGKVLTEFEIEFRSIVFGGLGPVNHSMEMYSLNLRSNRNGLFSFPSFRQVKALQATTLVIFHGFYLLSLFWVFSCTKKRIAVIPHGSISKYQHGKSKFAKILFRKVISIFDNRKRIKFYVASEQERQDVLEFFPQNDVINLGLWVSPSNLSKIRNRPITHKNICLITRLHPVKNIENLLIAFAKIRQQSNLNFFLFIAGEGDFHYVKTLKGKVFGLGLDPYVEFLGHLDGYEKDLLWDKCDLLCQISFYENFGQVVAESVMRGVPVVVSKNLGISSIIESTGTGFLVDPIDPQDIANAILQALENYPQLRFKCIQNRKVFSKEFVATRWIRQIEIDS